MRKGVGVLRRVEATLLVSSMARYEGRLPARYRRLANLKSRGALDPPPLGAGVAAVQHQVLLHR